MGDIKVFNSAGSNDSSNTITGTSSSNRRVGRVDDLFVRKDQIGKITGTADLEARLTAVELKASNNQADITEVVQGAPESMDTLKEVFDNLDIDDFIAGLNSD
jgi:hypothetical protein